MLTKSTLFLFGALAQMTPEVFDEARLGVAAIATNGTNEMNCPTCVTLFESVATDPTYASLMAGMAGRRLSDHRPLVRRIILGEAKRRLAPNCIDDEDPAEMDFLLHFDFLDALCPADECQYVNCSMAQRDVAQEKVGMSDETRVELEGTLNHWCNMATEASACIRTFHSTPMWQAWAAQMWIADYLPVPGVEVVDDVCATMKSVVSDECLPVIQGYLAAMASHDDMTTLRRLAETCEDDEDEGFDTLMSLIPDGLAAPGIAKCYGQDQLCGQCDLNAMYELMFMPLAAFSAFEDAEDTTPALRQLTLLHSMRQEADRQKQRLLAAGSGTVKLFDMAKFCGLAACIQTNIGSCEPSLVGMAGELGQLAVLCSLIPQDSYQCVTDHWFTFDPARMGPGHKAFGELTDTEKQAECDAHGLTVQCAPALDALGLIVSRMLMSGAGGPRARSLAAESVSDMQLTPAAEQMWERQLEKEEHMPEDIGELLTSVFGLGWGKSHEGPVRRKFAHRFCLGCKCETDNVSNKDLQEMEKMEAKGSMNPTHDDDTNMEDMDHSMGDMDHSMGDMDHSMGDMDMGHKAGMKPFGLKQSCGAFKCANDCAEMKMYHEKLSEILKGAAALDPTASAQMNAEELIKMEMQKRMKKQCDRPAKELSCLDGLMEHVIQHDGEPGCAQYAKTDLNDKDCQSVARAYIAPQPRSLRKLETGPDQGPDDKQMQQLLQDADNQEAFSPKNPVDFLDGLIDECGGAASFGVWATTALLAKMLF